MAGELNQGSGRPADEVSLFVCTVHLWGRRESGNERLLAFLLVGFPYDGLRVGGLGIAVPRKQAIARVRWLTHTAPETGTQKSWTTLRVGEDGFGEPH